jgi:hypothetical protein
MNYVLMEHIIRHVMANLAVISSSFVNLDKTKSLRSKEFLLSEKLLFENENITKQNNIWGCQVSVDHHDMKILLGDCSQDNDLLEFCLIVQLKDAPSYGLYLIYNDLDPDVNAEPLIAVSVNNKDWMECGTYLQGTFLAGMEQIRDLGLTWNKCTDYKTQYEMMLSFIKYHNSFYEETDAWKKS